MRKTGLAIIAALALAACGNSAAPAAAPDAAPASFPSLTAASYRAEATMLRNGRTTRVVQYRSGAKARMEFSTDQGAMASIVDPESDSAYSIMPAQRMAIRLPIGEVMGGPADEWISLGPLQPEPAGPCTVAGEAGYSWTLPGEEQTPERTACVSPDGVFLKSTVGNRTIYEVTRLTRGAQNEALFVPPAGYRVQDMSGLLKQ